jgi:alpha-L-rhamnosidase
MKKLAGLSIVLILVLSSTTFGQVGAINPAHLQCEYKKNSEGVGLAHPSLSWINTAEARGEMQSAYQVLVASSEDQLKADHGDFWDSGKVQSDNSTQVEYSGAALNSRQRCFWKVRTWDREGKPSPWSVPASWEMGLLKSSDWQAKWISDAVLADVNNRPRTPINCYRSELATAADTRKWIVLDLGSPKKFDSVNLMAARPRGLNMDILTVGFPRRFKVEVADQSDFSDARLVVDRTAADVAVPRINDEIVKFESVTARYIRLDVTRLDRWDANQYALFLARIEVRSEKNNVGSGAEVSCSDSIETADWSKKFLVNGKPDVKFTPFPDAVAAHLDRVSSPSRVPLLRREFSIDRPVRRATLYSTARGFYEMRINGQRVGNDLLAPGFTDYEKRISYQTHDVTALVHQGRNAIASLLGYGWYAGRMNLNDNVYFYGFFPQLLAQLEIELADGKRFVIGTDNSWQTTLAGPAIWSDLLDGEAYDCRKESPGWDKPGFEQTDWRPAWQLDRDDVQLVCQRAQPVREVDVVQPIAVKQVQPGVYVFDLGQEIAGWCRLKSDGPAGAHIKLLHVESVKPDGAIDPSSLWGTPQREDYILDGKGPRVLEPHFTYHGFRYVQVTGLAQAPMADTLAGIRIRTAAPVTGHFECSNALFNRIMTASQCTQQNMLFDVPTGCAARSERLAWNGDIRPCVSSALLSFDTHAFFDKFLIDLRDDQKPDGRFTDIAPHAHLRGTEHLVGSPGWADAGVTLPWDLFVQTGDKQAISDHFEAARRWVDFIDSKNPNHLWLNAHGMNWGDWLCAGTPTPNDIGPTAFFAHDADLVSRMAAVLGRTDDAKKYATLFALVRSAFSKRFVTTNGVITSGKKADTQGNYALSLQFGLLDEPLKAKAIARLAELVRQNNYHPTTGFWSSVELLLALSSSGQNDLASKMMNLEDKPSWGYMADHGGTFWEAFDADTRTLSKNHWTHSAVGEWLWRDVAGLNADVAKPGYESFTVWPRPTPEVNWCEAEYDSIRGPIQINWRQEAARFELHLTIPTGSSATIYLPTIDKASITESGKPIANVPGVKFIQVDNGFAVIEASSGKYDFTSATN